MYVGAYVKCYIINKLVEDSSETRTKLQQAETNAEYNT